MNKLITLFIAIIPCFTLFAQDVNQLITQAEQDLDNHNWEKAQKEFRRILSEYDGILTNRQKATMYNSLGYLDMELLEPSAAETNFNRSIVYHEKAGIPSEKEYADALLNLGVHYTQQVEYDLGRQYIQQSLDILEKLPENRVDYVLARAKMAQLYEDAGALNTALSINTECYNELVETGNDLSAGFAEICSHRGRILIRTGNPAEGEEFINLSAKIYTSLGDEYNIERAESMESLAIFYERMGRYNEAEKVLLQALELKRSIPNEAAILITETLNDLGILYQTLGNLSKAKQMFEEVIRKCEANVGTDHPYYATAKNNLGAIAIASGDLEQAKLLFTDALTIYKEKFGSFHPYYANCLNNLARVERKLGNTSEAEKLYKEVLAVDEKVYGKDHADYATTLTNLGVLYSSTGREQEADSYLKEALEIRRNALGEKHPLFASSLEYLGVHSLALGDEMLAEEFFRKAIQIQLTQLEALFPIMTEQEREAFYRNIREDIDRYNYVASEQLSDSPELLKVIFDFQIRTKAILFNTSDKVNKVVLKKNDAELTRLYNRWLSDKKLLASYYQMSTQEINDLQVDLNRMEAQVERDEKDLMLQIDEFEGSLANNRLDWKAVQNQVQPGEAVVEIIRLKEFKSMNAGQGRLFGFTDFTKYLAVVFQYGQKEPSYVLLGDEYRTEEQHYAKYKNAILFNLDNGDTYKIFWKPIDDLIGNVNFVRMAPDGIFYKMNPNSLKIAGSKFLIDKYYVSYLTSCQDLFKDDIEIFREKAFLFGNPDFLSGTSGLELERLPGAEEEISVVKSALEDSNWSVASFNGIDASELRIRSAYNPTVLHIATHGFFSDELSFIAAKSPMQSPLFKSGIYLSGASKTYEMYSNGVRTISSNDGILTAYEAINLDLKRTKLVVLSACESGLGSVKNGEGVYGLQRAFMVAGAQNIISTLAKVDDQATSELMISFYNKFVETNEVDTSIRYAQLALKEKYKNPGIWGAFILTGRG
ncbi:MAG: CHAT domain-containing tetratricopeptide repeat protein [Bacteroidota bacterium]